GDWAPQIFLDVVGEGAERRDVDTAHARFHSIRFKFSEKRIKNTKKPGQRFPASGWRGQQNRFTVKNGGNAEQLGVSETRKTREKPISQARMQSCGKSLLLFHKLKSRHPERNASPARTRGIPLRARNTGRWPGRPADIISAVSDSTEGCTVASSSAECNSAGRTDCKSVFQRRLTLPDSPGNACSSNAPGRAPSARIQSPPWRRLTIHKLPDFSLPDTYKRWHGPMECALPAFRQTPPLVARRLQAAAPPDQTARHRRLQKLRCGVG